MKRQRLHYYIISGSDVKAHSVRGRHPLCEYHAVDNNGFGELGVVV